MNQEHKQPIINREEINYFGYFGPCGYDSGKSSYLGEDYSFSNRRMRTLNPHPRNEIVHTREDRFPGTGGVRYQVPKDGTGNITEHMNGGVGCGNGRKNYARSNSSNFSGSEKKESSGNDCSGDSSINNFPKTLFGKSTATGTNEKVNGGFVPKDGEDGFKRSRGRRGKKSRGGNSFSGRGKSSHISSSEESATASNECSGQYVNINYQNVHSQQRINEVSHGGFRSRGGGDNQRGYRGGRGRGLWNNVNIGYDTTSSEVMERQFKECGGQFYNGGAQQHMGINQRGNRGGRGRGSWNNVNRGHDTASSEMMERQFKECGGQFYNGGAQQHLGINEVSHGGFRSRGGDNQRGNRGGRGRGLWNNVYRGYDTTSSEVMERQFKECGGQFYNGGAQQHLGDFPRFSGDFQPRANGQGFIGPRGDTWHYVDGWDMYGGGAKITSGRGGGQRFGGNNWKNNSSCENCAHCSCRGNSGGRVKKYRNRRRRRGKKESSETEGEDGSVTQEEKFSYDELLALEDVDVVYNKETIECPICFTECLPGEAIILRDCLHSFCRQCIIKTVEHCNEMKVSCPFGADDYICNSIIQHREIKEIVPKDLFENYLNKSFSFVGNQLGNVLHCNTADCSNFYFYDDDVSTFFCEKCNSNNCVPCKAVHEGMNCKEYQKELVILAERDPNARETLRLFQVMIEAKEALPCPTCGIVIVKTEGCDWIQCSMCKTEICWATLGPRWGPLGRGDTSGGCKCRLNGDIKCHPNCGFCH